MGRPDKSSKEYPSWKIEADRRIVEYRAAKENLEYLEGCTAPCWGDGEPMKVSDVRDMLKRSRAIVSYGDKHWGEYLDA